MKTATGSFIRGLLVVATIGITGAGIARANELDSLTYRDCEQMAQLAYDLAEGAESLKKVETADGQMWFDVDELSAYYLAQAEVYTGKGFNEIFTFTFQAPMYGPKEGKEKILSACNKAINEVSI